MIPELFVEHWWQHLLHNQSALILKGRLLFRRSTVVTSIPYRRDIKQTVGLTAHARQPACSGGGNEREPRGVRGAVHGGEGADVALQLGTQERRDEVGDPGAYGVGRERREVEPSVTATSHFGPVASANSSLTLGERVDLVVGAVHRQHAGVSSSPNHVPGKKASAPESSTRRRRGSRRRTVEGHARGRDRAVGVTDHCDLRVGDAVAELGGDGRRVEQLGDHEAHVGRLVHDVTGRGGSRQRTARHREVGRRDNEPRGGDLLLEVEVRRRVDVVSVDEDDEREVRRGAR